MAPIVEAIDWKYKAALQPNDYAIDEIMGEHKDGLLSSANRVLEGPQLLELRNNIYNQLFSDDPFLNKLYQLVPLNEGVNHDYSEVRQAILGKTIVSDIYNVMFFHPNIQAFLSQCFKIVTSRYGLLEQLMYMSLFSSYSLSKELTEKVVRKLLKRYDLQSTENIGIDETLEELTEKYLSIRLKTEELDFVDLYRLLILRHRLKKEYNDVCNALIDNVDKADLAAIMRALESDTDFSYDDIEEITYTPKYSQETSEFHHALYVSLNNAGKINYEIAFNAFLFFAQDMESCPLGLLILGSIYHMNETPGAAGSYAVDGFLAAGKIYFKKSLYEEAMLCFKTALFNIIYLFGEELREQIDMYYFKEITRKLNSYEKSNAFLSKFKVISDYGFPMDQGIMNEIEITKAELEYEYASRSYHKIDAFYELVAKENFPAIQSHVGGKDKGKFVLTGNQLDILLKKIQEKSDIIRGIKSISAKCDMLMYMHREVYDKQAAILETIKENQEIFENIISRNTDKIIENIHIKNEGFEKHINLKSCQEFYHGHIGTKLWAQLDEGTRTYLLLGRHLDTTKQYSPSDECAFIAIEYALAIENEFKRKLVDSFLSKEPHIKFKATDGIKLIEPNSRIALGEICLLLDKARKVKDRGDLLWSFVSFVENHTIGGNKIFDYKNALFDIKNRYRNPAAHPSNYTRDTLDAFKELLFEKGFICSYLEAIQVKGL